MEVAPFGVNICTLEPGGIRTNWARRAGQNAPELLPDYEASVGSILKLMPSLEGRSEGDPRKIADVISGCNERKLRVRARPRNGDISLFQRFLKMGDSTADCIWQIAESIPELPNH